MSVLLEQLAAWLKIPIVAALAALVAGVSISVWLLLRLVSLVVNRLVDLAAERGRNRLIAEAIGKLDLQGASAHEVIAAIRGSNSPARTTAPDDEDQEMVTWMRRIFDKVWRRPP